MHIDVFNGVEDTVKIKTGYKIRQKLRSYDEELYFLWTLWVLKTSAFTMRAFDLITIYIFDAGQGRVAKPNLQQRKK